MTDFGGYVKSWVNGFLYLLRVYMFQLLQVKIDKSKKCKVGKNRSLVRRISKWIPIVSPRRIYIKINTSTASSNALNNLSNPYRVSSQTESSDGLNSIRSLFDTTTDSCICWRSSLSDIQHGQSCIVDHEGKTINLQPKEHLLQSDSCDATLVMPDPRASTPLSFIDNAALSMSSSCAMAKISQLEEELIALRQQIACIAAMQESGNSHYQPNHGVLSQSCPAPPPPPPPPMPPPPPPPPQRLTVEPLRSLKDDVQQKKLRKTTTAKYDGESEFHGEMNDKGNVLPHMSDVLKGINAVKLRPVARSPGGTPIRRPALASSSEDPASLLAAALQRRFAGIHPLEISIEKENRRSFDGTSPKENENAISIKSKPLRL